MTDTTARTLAHVDASGFLADLHGEISDKSGNLFYLTVCINIESSRAAAASTIFGVRIQAAQSRVGKVLSSWDILPPIVGRLLHDIYLVAGICDVQRSLNTGDTAADYQGALGYAAFARAAGARSGCTLATAARAEDDGLFGSLFLILVNPGALLTDVCDFHHVGVQAGVCRSLAEGGFMHTRGTGTDNDACQFFRP